MIDTVKAFADGGAAVSKLKALTPGARANLAGAPVREFADVRAVMFVASQDVTGRRIERHGGAVVKVLFYRFETAQGNRWLLVHVTADNLITDYDVVDNNRTTQNIHRPGACTRLGDRWMSDYNLSQTLDPCCPCDPWHYTCRLTRIVCL